MGWLHLVIMHKHSSLAPWHGHNARWSNQVVITHKLQETCHSHMQSAVKHILCEYSRGFFASLSTTTTLTNHHVSLKPWQPISPPPRLPLPMLQCRKFQLYLVKSFSLSGKYIHTQEQSQGNTYKKLKATQDSSKNNTKVQRAVARTQELQNS